MSETLREYSQTSREKLRESLRAVWPMFLFSRLWCAIWVYAGHAAHPFREPIKGGYEGVSSWILNPWTTYDSKMYLALAAGGYDTITAPFFPLYPLLLRLAAPNYNAMTLLGVIVSNASLLLALMLLYLLVKTEDASTREESSGSLGADPPLMQRAEKQSPVNGAEHSTNATLQPDSSGLSHQPAALAAGNMETRDVPSAKRAQLAVFLMAFSPLSCIFSSVYTESFYALLLIAAFCCARGVFTLASTRAWLLAGFFASLAALTRNSGPIIFVALACEWFLSRRANPQKTPRITLLFVALPLLAFLAFQIALARHLGGFSSVTSQTNYGRRPMFPWTPIYLDIVETVRGGAFDPVAIIGLFAVLSALWMGFRDLRRRAPDAILVLGVLLMNLTLGRIYSPHTNSSLRLLSSGFPYWTMWSRRLESVLNGRTRVLAVAFYLLLGALMSYLFGLKTFVSG